MSTHEEILVVVSGKVQMVMYRDFAQRKARGLGVVGTVRNFPDGTVEVVAQASRNILEEYLEKLKKGPILARVSGLEVVWREPIDAFRDFTISF